MREFKIFIKVLASFWLMVLGMVFGGSSAYDAVMGVSFVYSIILGCVFIVWVVNDLQSNSK